MKSLRYSLRFNSLFSLATGLTLAVQSGEIAQLFGVQESWPFTVLGISLILFSAAVYYVSRQKRILPLPVLIIIVLDLVWVLASIPLIIVNPFEITQIGNILVGVVAVIVFTAAFMQSIGLSKVDKNPETGFKELEFERTVAAENHTVWKVISDVANYHHVAPNIDDVKILSGSGKGMVRQCSQGKGSWTEKCISWQDGDHFSFQVNTDEPNYPFPLSFLQGTWKVIPNGGNHTKIKMRFELQYNKKILNIILHPLMAPKFGDIVEELLDNWEKKLAEEGK